jgi:non-ribosomal peptide synthetase component F
LQAQGRRRQSPRGGNTFADINAPFNLTSDDQILGLANLGSDLSIYGIFGRLSTGSYCPTPNAGPSRPTGPSSSPKTA